MQWTGCGDEELCRMLHPASGLPRRLRLWAGPEEPAADDGALAEIVHMEDYPGFLRRRVAAVRRSSGRP